MSACPPVTESRHIGVSCEKHSQGAPLRSTPKLTSLTAYRVQDPRHLLFGMTARPSNIAYTSYASAVGLPVGGAQHPDVLAGRF